MGRQPEIGNEGSPQASRAAAAACAQLAGLLAGPRPAELAPLLAEGRFAEYGLPGEPAQDLTPLEAVPAVPLLRWWALLHLTGAFLPRVAAAFDWDALLVRRLGQLDAWYCAGMPKDRRALKQRLQAHPLPTGAAEAFAAFAALSQEFAPLPGEYAALLASGEPFCDEALRITDAQLQAEGVPRQKLAAVRRCLLEAVTEKPELNAGSVLAQLAHSLYKMV